MAREILERRACITGIGQSDVGRRLYRDPLDLTLDACLAAIEDAGLTRGDIDGIATYPGNMDIPPGFPRIVADPERVESDHERIRAVGDPDRVLDSEVRGGFLLEGLHLRAEDEPAGVEDFDDALLQLVQQRRVLRLDVNQRDLRHGGPV